MAELNLIQAIDAFNRWRGSRDARNTLATPQYQEAFRTMEGLQSLPPTNNLFVQEAINRQMQNFIGGAQADLAGAEATSRRGTESRSQADFETLGNISAPALNVRENVAASAQNRDLLGRQAQFLEQQGAGPTPVTANFISGERDRPIRQQQADAATTQAGEFAASGVHERGLQDAVQQFLEGRGMGPTPGTAEVVNRQAGQSTADRAVALQEALGTTQMGSELTQMALNAGMSMEDLQDTIMGVFEGMSQQEGPAGALAGGALRPLQESQAKRQALLDKIKAEQVAAGPGVPQQPVSPYEAPGLDRAVRIAQTLSRPATGGGFMGTGFASQPAGIPAAIQTPQDALEIQQILAQRMNDLQAEAAQLQSATSAEQFQRRVQVQQEALELNNALQAIEVLKQQIEQAQQNFNFLQQPQ